MFPAFLPLTCLLAAVATGFAATLRVPGPLPPTDVEGLSYTNEFFPGATYNAAVPSIEKLLGFQVGQRAANSAEIERCLKAWAESSGRTRLVEYARTHEQRPLHYMVVTAPKNLTRLETIQAGMAKLGDARKLADEEAERLIDALPAVAWLAYTIHGDETEGSDAALALLYHLAACTDPEIERLLEEVVVIVDPLMNPDGRDRFLKMVAEHRGTMPNVDDQSLLHEGYWPWGRGNHYLFDLNRDWILGVHPETRGRLREVARWNPLLFVDAHGMGAQATHLFSPPREPINPHLPTDRARWGKLFAEEQAKAFDQHHWLYYHGEWNEEWYPGYSDSWSAYRGAVGILYEQARIAEDGVRRSEGRILSYRESVHHHIAGSMANLRTLQTHAKDRLRSFLAGRREAVDRNGRFANRTFAVLPSANHSRFADFVKLMQLQGFELFQASVAFTCPLATDQLGRELRDRTVPAGTLLIPNRQPLAHLVAAMLDFDPKISTKALEEEREELLRKGRSRIYDTTAWNLTMACGLEALTLPLELPESAKPYQAGATRLQGLMGKTNRPVAYIMDGADDQSVTAAARLMERGVTVRVAEKAFVFDSRRFARGSVVTTLLDNRAFQGDLKAALGKTAEELGLAAVAVSTGLGEDEAPDLGGSHFFRLERPRIGLLSRGRISGGDFGSIWFVLDHHLGVRHSHLDENRPGDLQRYNVLVVPSGGTWLTGAAPEIKNWVRAGGTLIAMAGSASQLATEKADLSKVRTLPDVLGKLADYELAVHREWMAENLQLPAAGQIWSHRASPDLKLPWLTMAGPQPDEKELKKRDAWQSLFMPQGAILAGRVDQKHWLTFGATNVLPVLMGRHPILMAAEGVEAPIRLGYWARSETKSTTGNETDAKPKADGTEAKKEKPEAARIGWAAVPDGHELYLRMSGLLWPEASHRLANAAWVTREAVGRGQVILFASPPTFRAALRGPTRLFVNALIYGPGCGTSQSIQP